MFEMTSPIRKVIVLTANISRVTFSGLVPTLYPLRTMFSVRLVRLLIRAQPRANVTFGLYQELEDNKFQQFTGRKTPASTGTKIKTAWSDVVTIISVLLFFTARIESAVGSEKK